MVHFEKYTVNSFCRCKHCRSEMVSQNVFEIIGAYCKYHSEFMGRHGVFKNELVKVKLPVFEGCR